MPVFRLLFRSKTLILLFILCLLDAVCTDIGLRLHYIQEANPIIRRFYEWHLITYYIVKLIFPVVLMMMHPYIRQKTWVKPCLTLTVIVYATINAYHVVWLTYGLTLAGSP
ncbi:DUF5658 family protein [Paenibacillus roseipurpureus]|uniref:DUF5658 family protein n=1 Tax=Paenibacillus roseopurpureus TaxID=2918901 RepID=A0AA96LLP1_9BACL|nr:DUF5658 family protein [Paenibacillus sp. MBLB1832]WNR44207.1 DUF5658 family protein [Paenibacillus sp. MBLB1832]